ncbi:MAG TPA: tetratricopeptide repeat protein, partial [Chryseolinea sp.]|nr:tetratricopeptide repeat protein [Chryseolinea sp.]
NNVPVTAQDPAPANITLDEAEKKVMAEEGPSFSAGAKSGKDPSTSLRVTTDEKHLGWLGKTEASEPEAVPTQKGEQLQQDIMVLKSEKKEEDNFYRNKNAETTPKGNVKSKSEAIVRDADALEDVVLVSKEVSKNQNELESLKEKDKKDETKKTQSTTVNTEVVTATGASSGLANNQPVTDKSGTLAKQDNNKTADDRERVDENKVNRAQSGEGDVLALESGTKSKEGKSGGKGKKAKAPQKVSGGFYDDQTSTSAPKSETQSQTKTNVTESRDEVSGKLADSTVVLGGTFESTIAVDGLTVADSAMIKYDKQDYAGAVKNFEQALKQNPNDETALFYSAVSYLSIGETDKALPNFNKILSNKNSKYYDDAQWYSSLAYIKNNDMKNARMNLIQIQNNEKSRYKKQADETLEQIKK